MVFATVCAGVKLISLREQIAAEFSGLLCVKLVLSTNLMNLYYDWVTFMSVNIQLYN